MNIYNKCVDIVIIIIIIVIIIVIIGMITKNKFLIFIKHNTHIISNKSHKAFLFVKNNIVNS